MTISYLVSCYWNMKLWENSGNMLIFLVWSGKQCLGFLCSDSKIQLRILSFLWGFDLTVSEKNISRTSPRGPSSESNYVWFLPSAFALENLISSWKEKLCLLFRAFEGQNPTWPFSFLIKVWFNNHTLQVPNTEHSLIFLNGKGSVSRIFLRQKEMLIL